MGVWVLFFLVNLLFPLLMIGLGNYFSKRAPKEINYWFGYRTAMSMKNKDTWTFAHHYFGKIWFVSGLVTLPISVFVMLLVVGKTEDTVAAVGEILCGVQMIPLVGAIVPTERALRKTFDKNGNRR